MQFEAVTIGLSRRRILAGGLAAAGAIALAGCASEPPPAAEIPEIRFQDRPPFRLAASAVVIQDETSAAAGGLEWANIFPTLPRQAMRNWGQDRLDTDPSSANTARYRISRASIEYSQGAPEKGVFAPDRREKFLVRVAADLSVRHAAGRILGSVSANAWGEESVLVDAELADRKLAVDGLVRRVMADFDREMENAIRANMAELAF